MKTYLIRISLLWVLAFFCLWCPFVYKRITHGFRLQKCQLQWPMVPEWETLDLSTQNFEEIQTLLNQPFNYLAKGAQSFVFVSQNNDYVLKLFHFNQSKISFGKKLKNQWKKWTKGREIEEFYFKDSVKSVFESYKLAYDVAKDLSGLKYIHLNPQKKNLPIIQIRDRIGISYQIDPAQYRFILQKRADPFEKSLHEAMKIKSAEPLICSLLSLFKKLSDLGLANRDPRLARNFAYLNKEAIVIDAGSFFYDPVRAKEDVYQFSTRLNNFLQKYSDEKNNLTKN